MGVWWQRNIEYLLNWVQDFLRSSQPTFLYSAAESAALIAVIMLPWGVGCVLGWFAAKVTRKLLCASTGDDESRSQSEYRFTLRGMLLAVMMCAVLTAWLSGTVRQWHQREQSNQKLFLSRFESSFTTGDVALLAEPVIVENHTMLRASQNPTGISEYRVVASIERNHNKLWAVWTYLCDEHYPGTVSKFGYAEAATQAALPPAPSPMTEYLREPSYQMINGEPPVDSPAEIIDAPVVAKAGDTITIVAKTGQFLECELIIRPTRAITAPPPTIIAPQSGVVRWDVKLNPAFGGPKIEYEFQARTNMLYRAKTFTGTMTIEKQSSNEQLREANGDKSNR